MMATSSTTTIHQPQPVSPSSRRLWATSSLTIEPILPTLPLCNSRYRRRPPPISLPTFVPPRIPYLPKEILDETFAFLSLNDLLSVALVSKDYHAMAERHIYRYINLTTTAQVRGACATLRARPSAARAARKFRVKLNEGAEECRDEVLGTLMLLSNLTSLKLLFPGALGPTLTDLPFRLRSFVTSLDLDSDLLSFIQSQPSLTRLVMGGKHHAGSFDLRSHDLPLLTCYGGPSIVLSKLKGTQQLKTVILSDRVKTPAEVQRVMRALRRSKSSLQQFSCWNGWSDALIHAITQDFPEVSSICVGDTEVLYASLQEQPFIKSLESLERLTSLRELALPSLYNTESIQLSDSWPSSLRRVTLPDRKTRIREAEGGEWNLASGTRGTRWWWKIDAVDSDTDADDEGSVEDSDESEEED